MASTARLDLSFWRNDEVYEFHLRVRGLDLTGVPMRAQIRLAPDTPGAPLVDLVTVSNGNAEGIRLAGVSTEDGLPASDVRIRMNKSTRQALPYAGEIGDATPLAWAFAIAGRTRLVGNVNILAHALESDAAPYDRPDASAFSRVASLPSAGATITIAQDDGASLTIGGADALAPAVAQAEAARDAVRPLFGGTAPADAQGEIGQSYYQKTAGGSLIFYGPKTAGGWGDPISLRGNASGPLGAGSVTADTLSMNASERAAIAGLLPVLQKNTAFSNTLPASMAPIGVAPGLIYFESERSATIDMVYYKTRHLPGSSCYSLHIVDYAEAGASGGGSLGVALDGPGHLTVITANRQGAGNGNGILAQRLGPGNGSAGYFSFSGLGTGAAITALKQNNDGSVTPGAPCGLGPSLEIINRSSQGTAIDSTTSANNASLISNILRRENTKEGIVLDVQTLLGGPRTGPYTSLRVLHNPATDSTGSAAVTGVDLILGPKIKGAGETTVLTISNGTSDSTNAFGALIQSVGANVTNRALRLRAEGATNNIALEVLAGSASFAGLVAVELPTHADNAAAAASLAINTLYRTATGEVRARI